MVERNINMRQQSSNQQDPIEMIKKYINLLWAKKLWIVIITFIISLLWFFISPMVIKAPEYGASVFIKFDDPRLSRGISAVTDFTKADRTEGKVALLLTNSLLTKVVDSLKLNVQLQTDGILRYSFFNNIEIKDNPKFGNYKFIVEEKNVYLYYTNEKENIEDSLIFVHGFSTNSNLEVNIEGLKLIINPIPFLKYKEIKFGFAPNRFIVENLKQKIDKNLDRSQTVLEVIYTNSDPELAAAVINTVAKVYIDQLLNYKRYRTSSMIKSLREQLEVSQKEIEESEEAVRLYREKNPFLMLSISGSNVVSQLSSLQTELETTQKNYEHLNYLIQNKVNSVGENRDLAYAEIVSSISLINIAGSQVIQNQYNALLSEKSRLLSQNYSKDHMLVKDVNMRLKEAQIEIDKRVSQYIAELNTQKVKLQKTVSYNERNIRRLPRSELRLAELERDRLVKSNIYSSILIKYNEAKVADASTTSDAFIIEEAQVPIVYSNIFAKILNVFIGPLLGIILAIGIFITLDLLDRSVKDAKEVESRLNLPVLATIPVILDEKNLPDEIKTQKELDPKLITSNYAPSVANEKFRLLRTKLSMKNNENRAFMITSLLPGDGKSLIASNIAITFAQQKNSTLLIDGDIRRGVLHSTFKCNKKPGLVDMLIRNSPINESEISKMVQSTHIPNLFLLSSGIQAPNPSELLGLLRMEDLYNKLKEKFSVIIIDSPPIAIIPDAWVLNSFIHNMIFVVRYGKTNLNKLNDKITEYTNLRNDFRGVIINASPDVESDKYSSYSYYHY